MIKRYHQFLESHSQSLEDLCQQYGIKKWTTNPDGSIDVDNDVSFHDLGLDKLPIRFRNVSGTFDCGYNNLKSLQGCPQFVGDSFICYHNQLTTLQDGPQKVLMDYACQNNQIWTFAGVGSIKYDFYCQGNPIDAIYNLFGQIFNQVKVIETINLKYPDLFQTDGKRYAIWTDVLEEIAEELKVKLPTDYTNLLQNKGYQIT